MTEHTTRRAPHMERWVKVEEFQFDSDPPFWHVTLTVENQHFHISSECESEEEAHFHRDMLCIALDNLVVDEIKKRVAEGTLNNPAAS